MTEHGRVIENPEMERILALEAKHAEQETRIRDIEAKLLRVSAYLGVAHLLKDQQF